MGQRGSGHCAPPSRNLGEGGGRGGKGQSRDHKPVMSPKSHPGSRVCSPPVGRCRHPARPTPPSQWPPHMTHREAQSPTATGGQARRGSTVSVKRPARPPSVGKDGVWVSLCFCHKHAISDSQNCESQLIRSEKSRALRQRASARKGKTVFIYQPTH